MNEYPIALKVNKPVSLWYANQLLQKRLLLNKNRKFETDQAYRHAADCQHTHNCGAFYREETLLLAVVNEFLSSGENQQQREHHAVDGTLQKKHENLVRRTLKKAASQRLRLP